jgi:hypothetical protein
MIQRACDIPWVSQLSCSERLAVWGLPLCSESMCTVRGGIALNNPVATSAAAVFIASPTRYHRSGFTANETVRRVVNNARHTYPSTQIV